MRPRVLEVNDIVSEPTRQPTASVRCRERQWRSPHDGHPTVASFAPPAPRRAGSRSLPSLLTNASLRTRARRSARPGVAFRNLKGRGTIHEQ